MSKYFLETVKQIQKYKSLCPETFDSFMHCQTSLNLSTLALTCLRTLNLDQYPGVDFWIHRIPCASWSRVSHWASLQPCVTHIRLTCHPAVWLHNGWSYISHPDNNSPVRTRTVSSCRSVVSDDSVWISLSSGAAPDTYPETPSSSVTWRSWDGPWERIPVGVRKCLDE